MRLWRRGAILDRPLSCREVGKVLQRYLDDEIDDRTAAKVAEHLEDCRRCGLEAEIYTEIKAALGRQAPTLRPGAVEQLRRFGERLIADGATGDGDPTSSEGANGDDSGLPGDD